MQLAQYRGKRRGEKEESSAAEKLPTNERVSAGRQNDG